MSAPLVAIVIPSLDEEDTLAALLRDIARLEVAHEVVVCDGGSTDATCDLSLIHI